MRREYKSGSSWAVWRWSDVSFQGEMYLRRLILLRVPRVGVVMLHWILGPDPQPDLHDHPVTFLSIVVCGGYTEIRPSPFKWIDIYYVRWMNFIRATDVHRITRVVPSTITLAIGGPGVRDWGFHTPNGWVHWKDYDPANGPWRD